MHDLIALAPFRNHLMDKLRRVLQIGIHNDDGLPLHGIQPGSDGDLMAKVAAQTDHLEPRVEAALIGDQRGTAVTAAIIHQKHFAGAVQRIHQRAHPFEQQRQNGLFIHERYHEAICDRCVLHPSPACLARGQKNRMQGACYDPTSEAVDEYCGKTLSV